jgi:hypothetical protein
MSYFRPSSRATSLFFTWLFLGALIACGKSPDAGFGTDEGDGGIEPGADGSLPGTPGDGGGTTLVPPPTSEGGTLQGALAIKPLNPVVTVVAGQPVPTVPFTATVGGQAATATWLLDRGELGVISKSGVFTPSGKVAGIGNVTASYGGTTATTTLTVNIEMTQQGDPGYVANPPSPGPGGFGGVGGDGPGAPPSAGQVGTLGGTPTADTSVSLLYPYDGTVWPQGLLAPLLQWNAGSHNFDSAYVHITEGNFEYKGYFAANKTPFVNLPIPQDAWTVMGYSNGGEIVSVSLVLAEGSKLYGPYTESWRIAQGALQGTIYYNSYGTSFVKNSGSDGLDAYGNQYGAGTLAIAPGATAPTLVAGVSSVNPSGDGTGCRVCHTASADGTALVTQASTPAADSYARSVYINLTGDTTAGAGTTLATSNLSFPALYRDGTLLFSNGGTMSDLVQGDTASRLYSLPAGSPVAGVTGRPTGFQAGLPAFSPDGKHLSYNFWAGTIGASAGDKVSLGTIDFDGSKSFSNPQIRYTPTGGGSATYSSFLPNSTALVFEIELSNPTGEWAYTWQGHTAELWWLDIPTGKAHRLDQLNGYTSSGSVYLPNNAGSAGTHTSAQDATVNYEPTVTPIASGGYAWIVFTSRRMYGNVASKLDPWTSDPTQYRWQDAGNVTSKKLWVAAIDLNAAPGKDPSYPAFYLPGQELYAGNSRGYWTVPPCRPDGTACDVGDECCGGYCQTAADGGLVCTAQKPTCAGQYEKCTTTGDCCGATQGIQCINNICTVLGPPK